jgi:hypothetical protein
MSSDIKDTSSNNNNDINNKKKLNNIEELSKLLADDILNIIKNKIPTDSKIRAQGCSDEFICGDYWCGTYHHIKQTDSV